MLVTVDEFEELVEGGKGVVVDVRTPGEFGEGHIVGAINVNWEGRDFVEEMGRLGREKPLLVYCQSGMRSSQACAYLESEGWEVRELRGGIGVWGRSGRKVVR